MTREEAIERIKSRYDKWALDDKDLEAIQYIFPELKENEDEKIRKWLISYIKNELDDAEFTAGGAQMAYNAIAWLEKQKEQNHDGKKWIREKDYKEQLDAQYAQGLEDGRKEQNIYKSSKSEIDFADRYSKDVWEKLMSKFKEVEGYRIGCNDMSDIVLNAILNAFKWQKEQKSNLELIKQSWYTEGYTDGKFKREPMWNLKTGKDGPRYEKNEKYGQPLEQKPANWSEEDSRKIGTLSSIIADYAFYKDVLDENNDLTGEYAELDNWLGTLPERFNLQPKQEWSEKDKDIINEVASILINDENRADNKAEEDRLAYLAEKIQSLHPQPHWKPSEEQMEALAWYSEDRGAQPTGDKAIKSLYNDLQKHYGHEVNK